MNTDTGELAKTKSLLTALHIPGTCIQVSNEKTVVGYNGMPLDKIIEAHPHENLYFLANIPPAHKYDVPHLRSIKDADIPAKRYVVFDIDLRKTLHSDEAIHSAAESIRERVRLHTGFAAYRAFVHSGNGIHIYYTESTPIAVTIAQYAYGYKALCAELERVIGYAPDAACSNVARIMRLPGSLNNKDRANPRPVTFLDYQDTHANVLETIMLYKHSVASAQLNVGDFLESLKNEPIMALCAFFGIEVTRDQYVIWGGEKTSIRLNLSSNLVKRFSDKPGTGNFVHLYAALHALSFMEAAREVAQKYTGKELVMHDNYLLEAQREEVKSHRLQKFENGYDPLEWNTKLMNGMFPVIKNYSYVVCAGETKSGKTTVAFDLGMKNAKSGRQILYVTLEMTRAQLIDNIARHVADITPQDERTFLRTGEYPDGKHAVYMAKKQELEAVENMIILGKDYGSTMTIDDILAKILEYPDVEGVIIDNLDKIDRRTTDKDDFEKQKTVSHQLLEFTSTFKIPVILIHHLKKGQDTGGGGMFRTTNALSGTGKISHDADMVIFVARAKNQEDGTFKSNETYIRVMETREFEPCMHRLFFVNGTFVDEDPSRNIFRNAYVNPST